MRAMGEMGQRGRRYPRFLAAEDCQRIEESLIPHYFPAAEVFGAELDSELVGFYRSYGFVITGRDKTDADGRPYSMPHMWLGPESRS